MLFNGFLLNLRNKNVQFFSGGSDPFQNLNISLNLCLQLTIIEYYRIFTDIFETEFNTISLSLHWRLYPTLIIHWHTCQSGDVGKRVREHYVSKYYCKHYHPLRYPFYLV